MSLLHTLNNGGPVEYTPGRKIVHFGTPEKVVEAQYAADRLKARGFLLEMKEEPQ